MTQSFECFRYIFDQFPDPVLVLKADRTVELVNNTLLRDFQLTQDQVIGHPCYQVLHQFDSPCDTKGGHCPFPAVLAEGATERVIQRYLNAQGQELVYEISMCSLFWGEGTDKRVIKVIKDITSHQRLEEALKDSEEKTLQLLQEANKCRNFLETIVNGIQDHMMVIDLNYRIIEANQALLKMAGFSRKAVIGKRCYEVSHHADQPCTTPDHPCPLNDAVRSGKPASATHVHFDKNGREHYYHVVCHPIFDEEGRVTRIVDLSRDITAEIIGRSRILHDDKMASLGKLSASVVHEINNPLTGILNFITLIQRVLNQGAPGSDDLEKLKEYLAIMNNETSRISKTISNLLTFSRKTKPELRPEDLNQVIDETVTLIRYQTALQQIKISFAPAQNLKPVMADKSKMKQALLNLCLNAQDAMPQGGTLTITTENYGNNEIRVKVKDTGVGIAKEHYSQIFEPFFTTKQKETGAGLGLSVVYGIIKEHCGKIKVDSILGKGTTFTICLPAWKPIKETGKPI
jgi:two-component system, NtrC family, sensor kinase